MRGGNRKGQKETLQPLFRLLRKAKRASIETIAKPGILVEEDYWEVKVILDWQDTWEPETNLSVIPLWRRQKTFHFHHY
jgi:hypothetical protein